MSGKVRVGLGRRDKHSSPFNLYLQYINVIWDRVRFSLGLRVRLA